MQVLFRSVMTEVLMTKYKPVGVWTATADESGKQGCDHSCLLQKDHSFNGDD